MRSLLSITAVVFLISINAFAGGICTEAGFVNGDIQSSIATQGSTYTPRCLRVLVGSKVTISASKYHPLAPGNGSKGIIPATETTVEILFDSAGTYPYFCSNHGSFSGEGMTGEIQVVK